MPLRDTDEYLSAHGDRMEQLRIQEDAYRAISRKNSFLEMMLARRYKKEQREAFKREIEEQRKLEAAETLKGKLVKSKETISTSESDSDMGGLKIASGGESGNENQPRSSKRIASDSEASRASRSRSRSRSKSGSRSRSSSRLRYASRSRSPSRSRSRSRSRSVSGSRPKMEDYISELIRWYQMVRE